MDIQAIFGLQFVFSVLVFALIAKWFLLPWLGKKSLSVVLMVLILPHAFRHIGLSFLNPNLNAAPLPDAFATWAAYGDFASAILALVALVALRADWKSGLAFVWLFNIIGTADLLNALRQAEVVSYFGATWFIPTLLVPLLLVSHFLIFTRLIGRNSRALPVQQPV